jgi:hypothetical protein
MCSLVIETGLTILVCILWNKAKLGWAWGLVPVASALAVGFMLGLALGNDAFGLALFVDFSAIIALIIMAIVGKRRIK